jgi:hypothetical protein
MAAPAGNDGRRTPIVEMRQQHRRGDWPGPVRSEDPKDTTRPLLLLISVSPSSCNKMQGRLQQQL